MSSDKQLAIKLAARMSILKSYKDAFLNAMVLCMSSSVMAKMAMMLSVRVNFLNCVVLSDR